MVLTATVFGAILVTLHGLQNESPSSHDCSVGCGPSLAQCSFNVPTQTIAFTKQSGL